MATTLIFSKQAFWSDDFEALSPDTDGDYIIARVFDAGTFDDMRNVLVYYGQERVKKALLSATDLQDSTVAHATIWLEVTPDDFYVVQRRMLNVQPYRTF